MIHRQALDAAHSRIAHLEREVEDQRATILRLMRPVVVATAPPRKQAPNDETFSATPAEPDPLRWLALWPVVVFSTIAAIYLLKFGVSFPAVELEELWPFRRGSLGAGAMGAALMATYCGLRARDGGRSSVTQRVVTVLAGIAFAPFVVGLVASGAVVGSMEIGRAHV